MQYLFVSGRVGFLVFSFVLMSLNELPLKLFSYVFKCLPIFYFFLNEMCASFPFAIWQILIYPCGP